MHAQVYADSLTVKHEHADGMCAVQSPALGFLAAHLAVRH